MDGADSDRGLVIVPAGAGAGKTHRIKTQLSDWVKRKIVRPERILAVTFTEAAAGELRERIRAGLLADGLVTEAMAVERAYLDHNASAPLRESARSAMVDALAAANPSSVHAEGRAARAIVEDARRGVADMLAGRTVEAGGAIARLQRRRAARSPAAKSRDKPVPGRG